MQAVRQPGRRAVLLEVDYPNEPAIALYQRLGFEQLAARENYYGPGPARTDPEAATYADWADGGAAR